MYADAIRDITETRESARTPSRDTNGINLIFRYYNLLYYVERRFFPYGKCCISIISSFYFIFSFDRIKVENRGFVCLSVFGARESNDDTVNQVITIITSSVFLVQSNQYMNRKM